MMAFVMNAVAWEPVIKETHWFGQYEYYDSPLIGNTDCYIGDYLKDFSFQSMDNWTHNHSGSYYYSGNGNIGENSITIRDAQNNVSKIFSSTTDNTHLASEYCVALEARWVQDNGTGPENFVQYTQETTKELPVGSYRLSFDIQNVNAGTTTAEYSNYFYVLVGGEKHYSSTNWMEKNSNTGWATYTIDFTITDYGKKATISLGYGTNKNNFEHTKTPALFVSHLNLQVTSLGADLEKNRTKITWGGQNNQYIESITVVKDHTGKDGESRQRPKTSFYSWFDHELRFSVNVVNNWNLGRNSKHENVLGLKNMSLKGTNFWIHNLKQGDQFNIEYYRHPDNEAWPFLVSGDVNGRTGANEFSDANVIYGSNTNAPVYYTMKSDGDVQINIPSGAVIRSVSIIHKNYKKATFKTEQITTEGKIGYKTTMTGAGVLEDKYGAVPYITMRYGSLNDMTIVRKLGDGDDAEYGASCIIDASDTFEPGGLTPEVDNVAKMLLEYRKMTESHLEDWHTGKEWTVFTSKLTYKKKENSEEYEYDEKGNKIVTNDFASILPLYGSYYYFFPEVKGKLKVRFYCEGENEHMPFWNKTANWYGTEDSHDSNGENYYEYETDVDKDNVYYLCSTPTNISHEIPVIRLISYSFTPDFSVEPLYKVVNNTTDIVNGSNAITYAAEIKGGPYTNMNTDDLSTVTGGKYIRNGEPEDRVKCLGNVASAKAKVYQDGERQYLGFYDIKFKSGTNANGETYNHGGAIVAHLKCEYGEASFVLTIAYDAANAKWGIADGKDARVASTTGGEEVKHWDFYSGNGEKDILETGHGWDLGKYGEGNYPLYDPEKTQEQNQGYFNSPKIWKETHKADGLKADWQRTYVNLKDEKEPIFKSVYDMEGDNADMIHETAGLVFHVGANQLGIWNENPDPESSFQDRYLGLMNGGKLVIPRLKQNDRVVIKMGSYGNCDANIANEPATIKLTNAKDATGTQIPADAEYVIGGSIPYDEDATDDVTVPHGEYHFIVNQTSTDDNTDFAIEVTDKTKLLKIYSIEIYRNAANDNADILTENEVTGNKNEILYTADVNGNKSSAETIDIQLRYNGKNEPKSYFAPAEGDKANYTGTFRSKAVTFTGSEGTYTYTPANTEFGAFKARMGVKTTDNTYVTDYADRYMAVGYRETKQYPYTWDFTDLRSYVGTQANHDYLSPELSQPVSEWGSTTTHDYALHLTTDKFPGVLFASGSQLYAGANVFEESAGIGFKRDESLSLSELKAYDEGLQLLTDGLKLDCPNDKEYRLVIPQVGANAAVYVRATPLDGVSSKFSTDGTSASTWTEKATASDDDKIYAFKNDGSSPVDIELWLNHMIIRKIAVATDEKTVNAKGWATESRERVTDPELAAYMTGKDIRTYVVSNVNYAGKQVTLTRIDNENYLVPIARDGDNNATILLNFKSKDDKGVITGEPVDIINGGFHLFVPDMHDAETKTKWSGTNYLVSQVSGSEESPAEIPAVKDGFTNFAFTCMYYDIDPETGAKKSEKKVGPQAFYRIAGGKTGKASSKGNQGYLPILTSEVGYPVESSTSTGGGNARFTLVIIDDDEATGIATVEQVAEDNGRFFNLSGQQLSGKPNRSGLYIVNGKKVYIKNK